MAKAAGVSPATVQRVWSARGLKPHLVRTFKLSNDRRFDEKLIDVVGVYLNSPDKAVVLCMDEKSQIQALDRTQPSLPLKKGRAGTKHPRLQARRRLEGWRVQAASALRGDSRLGCGVDGPGQSHRWLSPVDRWRLLRREPADCRATWNADVVVLRQYPDGLGLQGSLEKEIANLGVVAGKRAPGSGHPGY